MQEFLYWFGYEKPIDVEVNEKFGTDQECAAYVRIIAQTEKDALDWGQKISQNYVAEIFHHEGKNFDWRRAGYSFGIEKTPDEYTRQNFHLIPVVNYGEYPDTYEISQPFED